MFLGCEGGDRLKTKSLKLTADYSTLSLPVYGTAVYRVGVHSPEVGTAGVLAGVSDLLWTLRSRRSSGGGRSWLGGQGGLG